MISQELLDLLICPESHQRLNQADSSLVTRLNQAIASRRLKNRAGRLVEQALDGALVREDGELAYPIVDGIPVMLVDQAIGLKQVETG